LFDVKNLTDGIINQQASVIENATNSAVRILNMIPGASKYPQLSEISPRFFAIPDPADTDHKIQITFQGNFIKASEPKFCPHLRFDRVEYEPISSTVTELKFEVPFDVVFNRKMIHKIGSSSNGELILPHKFEGGWFLGFNQQLTSAVYKVFLRSLPCSPGEIYLEVSVNHRQRDERYLRSRVLRSKLAFLFFQ
jgi:hypothetical protein